MECQLSGRLYPEGGGETGEEEGRVCGSQGVCLGVVF